MELRTVQWKQHENNPIIKPGSGGFLIADPTVLTPTETPDGRWHMYANSMPPRLHHFVSDDGLDWKRVSTLAPRAMRPYVRVFHGKFHMFYEEIRWFLPLRSRIVHRVSDDLVTWSKPESALEPQLPWHGRFNRTCSNPCVVHWHGEYRMFYSAGTVFLPDCLFYEPFLIGMARSDSLDGPWIPDSKPAVVPTDSPMRDMGAGSIKVVPDVDRNLLWGFNNPIYTDEDGRSRSCIVLGWSVDGTQWSFEDTKPLIAPANEGWTRGLVYAMDPRLLPDGTWRMYFNARDGWLRGKERIGVAIGTPAPS